MSPSNSRVLTSESSLYVDMMNKLEMLLPNLVANTFHIDAPVTTQETNTRTSMYSIYSHPQLGLIGSHAPRNTTANDEVLEQCAHTASQHVSMS